MDTDQQDSEQKFQWTIKSSVIATVLFTVLWQLSLYACDFTGWYHLRANLAWGGTTTLFIVGLGWFIFWLERETNRIETNKREETLTHSPIIGTHKRQTSSCEEPTNNPLDISAWYYGEEGQKLKQSVLGLSAYSFAFMVIFILCTQLGGCQESFEMPAGGGEQVAIAQTVKVQKVIKKKYIINPYSAISFKIPPIDEVKLQLQEVTKHAYTVGYGQGKGAGFAGGTNKGEVRFIRLQYSGGDWDQGFGVGSDTNMLIEYGVRTQQKTAKHTESRTIAQVKNFHPQKSPPFLYLTGQKSISLSNGEVKVLRAYVLDKHGMIFGDNGGSKGFHNQFIGMMKRVLPEIRPVRVPLDDRIHRIPYQIPFLPYLVPHGGTDALGWRVDGRLVAYYHPGDIGDIWGDDHAGVKPEISEACYQLGTNVIFYAYSEYSKWLVARQQQNK